MSNSRHPIALRLEHEVGGHTRLLAIVMGLPLVDGIFPALVLAGALDTIGGILQVGLLVFGGSATVAVILAEMSGAPHDHIKTIAIVGAGLLLLAAIEAALAPIIGSMLDLVIFERFAALVLLAVAAKTASARVGEYLPRPAVIVALGLLASINFGGTTPALVIDTALVLRGIAAAGVGVAFALCVALLGSKLRGVLHLDRFRFGSAVALGTLPLGLLGVVPGNTPLAVLGVTCLLAFDPGDTEDSAAGASIGPEGAGVADHSWRDRDERAPWL